MGLCALFYPVVFMKALIVLLFPLLACTPVSAQFVAKLEVKEPIEGVCNDKEVYALFPMFDGQEEAICPLSKEAVQKRLNAELAYLQENPKHSDGGMVHLLVNCKGEVVSCQMDHKTKSPVLDEQIIAVFKALGNWQPGKLNGKAIDSSNLWSFKIKRGKVQFD
jgi:hypothetical protein